MNLFSSFIWILTAFIPASRGITVTQPEAVTVSEGQDATIKCKTDAGIYDWGLAWYQQKPGEAPKLIIKKMDELYDVSFSRFSGNGARDGTDFTLTISGVQTEDAAHYYCQSFNCRQNSVGDCVGGDVFTQ
uniref:Ig-like domain-containing protein n=1 Tax=Cyprinus carpio carpio TaxID=630221 RepID=A0A8C1BBK8_CYPCA